MRPETETFYRQVCRNVFLGKASQAVARLGWLFYTLTSIRFNKYEAIYTNGQGESVYFLASILATNTWWVHHHHTAGDADDQTRWGKRYRKALQITNSVIACSQRNAKMMELALNRRVDSIPCFSRAVLPIPNNSPLSRRIRLGYYGRLIPEKGIDLICKLSEDVDLVDIAFHIWGEGDAYPVSFFTRYANVTYHGSFDGLKKLTQVLHSLDGLLLLTKNAEGLPISLLESMSAGLPWLSTDQGGIPDIALDPTATRVISSAASYDQIKKAVLALAADLRMGRISGQQQVALYARKFSADVLVNQWRSVLKLDTACNEETSVLNI